MAGSYNHCVTEDGKLRSPFSLCTMLETTSGDVYEAIEEMYGMIWFLAAGNPLAVNNARESYKTGLLLSPGLVSET